MRELVEDERARRAAAPAPSSSPGRSPAESEARTIQVGSAEEATSRHTAAAPTAEDAAAQAHSGAGAHLVEVHDGLRAELTRLRDIVEQVVAGEEQAHRARNAINELTMRQNNWTLGAYCAQYCRFVTGHHGMEDRSVFPHLRRSDPALDAGAGPAGVGAPRHPRRPRTARRGPRRPGVRGLRLGRAEARRRPAVARRCWSTCPTRRSSWCPRSTATASTEACLTVRSVALAPVGGSEVRSANGSTGRTVRPAPARRPPGRRRGGVARAAGCRTRSCCHPDGAVARAPAWRFAAGVRRDASVRHGDARLGRRPRDARTGASSARGGGSRRRRCERRRDPADHGCELRRRLRGRGARGLRGRPRRPLNRLPPEVCRTRPLSCMRPSSA